MVELMILFHSDPSPNNIYVHVPPPDTFSPCKSHFLFTFNASSLWSFWSVGSRSLPAPWYWTLSSLFTRFFCGRCNGRKSVNKITKKTWQIQVELMSIPWFRSIVQVFKKLSEIRLEIKMETRCLPMTFKTTSMSVKSLSSFSEAHVIFIWEMFWSLGWVEWMLCELFC